MNQLTRMLFAGMILAAMTTSRTLGGATIPTGSMIAATAFVVTSGAAPENILAMHPAEPCDASAVSHTRALTIHGMTETQLAQVRAWIASELAKLGRDHSFATDAASQLTPADLSVLAANPKMLQPAGRLTTQQENLLWAVVIVAGIVALILAADSSSVSIHA